MCPPSLLHTLNLSVLVFCGVQTSEFSGIFILSRFFEVRESAYNVFSSASVKPETGCGRLNDCFLITASLKSHFRLSYFDTKSKYNVHNRLSNFDQKLVINIPKLLIEMIIE